MKAKIKIEPREVEIGEFLKSLQERNFYKNNALNTDEALRGFVFKKPHRYDGQELVLEWRHKDSGYRVVILTTIDDKTLTFREKGEVSGIVFIFLYDTLMYYTRAIVRRKYFLWWLLCYAWVAKYKIINRPKCPHCGNYMDIYANSWAEDLQTRQSFWACFNPLVHEDPCFEDWNKGLPPRADAFTKVRRVRFVKYRAKNEKLGLDRKNKYKPIKEKKNF